MKKYKERQFQAVARKAVNDNLYGFICQDCGEFHAFHNEHGVFVPIDDGKLNVHHIVPVKDGGGNEPSNLITLCIECHMKRHRRRKE